MLLSAPPVGEETGPGPRPRILVAGLGNPLMGDDGIGVAACRAWLAERPRPCHYLVAEVGTAICGALHLLEWADRILVLDAMQAGAPPGSLYLADGRELETRPGVSLHELGLLAAISMVRRRRPPVVQVLGVEPAVIALGENLSAPVSEAVSALVAWGRTIVAGWRERGAASYHAK